MPDPTLTGFENWPSHNEPASSRSQGGGFISTILPVLFGLIVGAGIGALYLAKPAGRSKRASGGATVTEQMTSYVRAFGGNSGKSKKKGMSWQDQLNQQAEDNNAELQRLKDDIDNRLKNSWRPGG